MDTAHNEAFFDTLPVFEQFEGVADGDNYGRCPTTGRWHRADIVGSTKAIASGRYKAVNMAGASVISAILNGVGRRDLPFVFGGDGAFVAIPGSAIEATPAGAGGGQDLGRGRIAARSARRDRADGRHPRARPRRARRPLPGQLRDRLRHVHRRRRELGRSADEGRQLCGRRRAGRHAAGPHRPLLPLEPDRGPPWRHRFHHRHPRRQRQPMQRSSNWFPTSSHWPPSRSAAATRFRRRPRSSAFRRAGWTTKRAPPRRRANGCGRGSSFSPRRC